MLFTEMGLISIAREDAITLEMAFKSRDTCCIIGVNP